MDYESSSTVVGRGFPSIQVEAATLDYTMAPTVAETNGSWATFITYLESGRFLGSSNAESFSISYAKRSDSEGPVNVYFDNITIEPILEAPTSIPHSPEYFRNRRFEAGLDDWTVERVQFNDACYVKVVLPGLNGKYAVRFAASPYDECSLSMQQKLPELSPRTYYLLSFDYSTNSANATLSDITLQELVAGKYLKSPFAGTIVSGYTMCQNRTPCNGTFTLPVIIALKDVIFSARFDLESK